MAPYFQKPESAFKRAEELIAVKEYRGAMLILHEVILSKRARSTPLTQLEPMVLRFVELAVMQGKGKAARDCLFQYKNLAQNHSIITIEVVVKKFLELSKKKLEEAQQKAKGLNLSLQIDEDLEASETPESILLSTVSTSDSKDRMNRQVVVPHLRFYWEALRTGLDTLKNNGNLEPLYQTVVEEAFKFCHTYTRKTEYRKLCETLRRDLGSSARYAHLPFAIDLNNPETLQRHLQTRFTQLQVAAELELWQEAFKSIEDIYNLIDTSKKTPKHYMMAKYYEMLSKIWMKGENGLFHSASLQKYVVVHGMNPSLPEEIKKRNASQFLVSVLAIPLTLAGPTSAEGSGPAGGGDDRSKSTRLVKLLLENEMPTREALLQQALTLLPLVSAEAQELYQLLEVQFHPLSICKKVVPLIKSFSAQEHLQRYVKPLHHIILTRLLQQLGQVYSSIQIATIVKLASFPAPFQYDAHDIEKFVVAGCKAGEFSMRIDQKAKSLVFEPTLKDSATLGGTNSRLHSFPVDNIRSQLRQLTVRLSKTIKLVDPSVQNDKDKKLIGALQEAYENMEEIQKSTYRRRQLLQKKQERKDELEAVEERKRHAKRLEAQAAEQSRLAKQEKILAAERLLQQRKDIEKVEAQKVAEKIAAELREKNVKIKDDEIMDTSKLIELQINQLEKERRDLAQKSKALSKRIDYTERAFRKEEEPLLIEDHGKQERLEREAYESKKSTILQTARTTYDLNVAAKARVSKMMEDYTVFRQDLVAKREEYYDGLRKEAEEKIEEEKAAYRQDSEHRAAEKVRLEKEAKLNAEKEVIAKKAKAEAMAAKAVEQAALQVKLEEQARKQREKELEIEEKMARASVVVEKEKPSVYRPPIASAASGAAAPSRTPIPRPAVESTSWRRTEAAPSISRTTSESPSMAKTASSESSSSAIPPTILPAGGWRAKRAAQDAAAASGGQETPAPPAAESTGPKVIGAGKWTSARRGGKS